MTQIAVEAPPPVVRANRISLRSIPLFCVLALLWFILCRVLSQEWSTNEQYSYGWFVPFFAAFLFWLRWEDCPAQDCRAGAPACRPSPNDGKRERLPYNFEARPVAAVLSAILALAVLLPVRLFEIANPDWRPLGWVHALAVVGLTLLAIWSLGGKPWLRHFAFPIAFLLVGVPWVTPVEAPLVQGLMRLVAAIATETLTLFGIPAQLEGSLIRINSGVIGVSEACSGVRSLQTSLMIGLLFGELKRLTMSQRAVLVLVALTIAFVANCGRTFFLVWIAATQNLDAVGRWHDFAGYAIVGLVFLGTLASGAAIGKGKIKKDKGRNTTDRSTTSDLAPLGSLPPASFFLLTFVYLVAIEFVVEGWYRWHERKFVETTSWRVHWPESAPGFHELPIDENVRSTLRFDTGREVAWRLSGPASPNDSNTLPRNCTLFFFRWNPGSASILRARAHRPDICLPNTGWRVTHDDGVRSYAVSERFALPFRHFRFLRDVGNQHPIFAQAFFCQREDRVPPSGADRFDATSGRTGNWMRSDRLRVVREGLRNQGQQVLELVMMSPHEIDQEKAEAEFARLLPQLVKPVSELTN